MRRISAFTLIALFAIAAIEAIMVRGPWYDEFYSFYLVRPGTPLGLLWPAWLRDNHPPLFYALAWLWVHLLGSLGVAASVQSARTLNLLLLALALGLMVLIERRDAWFGRIAWYYAAALAATLPAVDQIDQLRSYFLSFVLTALLLPLLARQLHRPRPSARHTLATGVVMALAFSVHLVTTVLVGGLVAGAIARLALARHWHDAARVTLLAALAAVPFAITIAVQLATLMTNTQTFWIPPGLNGARWAIEAELVGALGANPVLGIIGLAGLAATLLMAMRHDAGAEANVRVISSLIAGLALALAILVAAHLHRPLLITRYLVAIDPVVAFILAIGASALVRSWPATAIVALDLAVLAASGFAIHANLDRTLHQPSWYGSGRLIAALVRACPDTQVHANMDWNANPRDFPPRENRAVVPFAYATVAHQLGFALAPAASRQMSRDCPTLFWTEHVSDQHPTARQVLDRLHSAGYPVRSGRMVRIGRGWVLIARP